MLDPMTTTGRTADRQDGPAAEGHWLEARQVRAYAREGTTAYRVGGAAEGWVERFGDDYIVSGKTAAARLALVEGLNAWAAATGACVSRVFARDLPLQPSERDVPELLTGDPQASRQTVVTEGAMRFGIDFAGGYAAGLFLDQRHNRALVRRLKPKRMLNCFAYTCSFSVAAALDGGRTVSIDLSARALDRGRDNFRENGLDPARHLFLAQDVLEALPPLLARNERFDMVILDPPTFSRGARNQTFHVERDLEPLLLAALDLTAGTGRILLSTNALKMDDRHLEGMARRCLRHQRRTADLHHEPLLVPVPGGPVAHTLWLNLR
jgi:23S rRNA (cytosine1962-C5)-methyltransferase